MSELAYAAEYPDLELDDPRQQSSVVGAQSVPLALNGVKRSPTIAKLALALAKAQGSMEVASKDSSNPFFRSTYADFASVREAARKPLAENGLAFCQLPRIEVQGTPEFQIKPTKSGDERVVVKAMTTVYLTTLLMHESGEWIENELFTVIPAADPQSIGSAVTYLRRYSLAPMVGVAAANEDDDGNAASGQPKQQQHTAPVLPKPKGFDEFMDTLTAVADNGFEKLNAMWQASSPDHRNYLVATAPETWNRLKQKARSVDTELPSKASRR